MKNDLTRIAMKSISTICAALLLSTYSTARIPDGPCPLVVGPRDNKTVAGTICVVDQPSGPSDYWSNSFVYSYRGGICNRSDRGKLKVRCPIVRDRVANNNGIGCAQVFFRDEDFEPGTDLVGREVECVLRGVQDDGDFIADGYTVRTNSSQDNLLNEIQLYLNESSAGGYYVISCNLPPWRPERRGDFCLQSIHWSEFAPTDP